MVNRESDPRRVCKRCEELVGTKRVTPGSVWVELLLFLCFIVPGLLYSGWRLAKRHDACRECGSAELVPANSAAGKRIRGPT